ncbi:short chain aldehyde dehydrogenase 1 [Vigna angularis]|nr:short chain aldehyde dehydrogenase 1 [Vigna angularis]
MSVIDILTRVNSICKKYDKYDVEKHCDSNVSSDNVFARLYTSIDTNIEALLQRRKVTHKFYGKEEVKKKITSNISKTHYWIPYDESLHILSFIQHFHCLHCSSYFINSLSMASLSKRLEGKVAIITGGASGIGAATAKLFLQHGAKVIIADVQDALGHSLCKTFTTNSPIHYLHCDVTSDSDVKNVVEVAITKYGKLDIMFNNAGISGDSNRSVVESDEEDFKRVLEVNVYGAFLGSKHAARFMVPAKRGVILFTSSIASLLGGETSHAYAVSKHAVVGLMKNLCVELGQHGIRVNCVCPGGIPTPMLNEALKMNKKETQELLCKVAVLKGTVLEAEDIAKAALYLCSDEAKFVSGVNLVLDGGYSTTNMSFNSVLNGLMDNCTNNINSNNHA